MNAYKREDANTDLTAMWQEQSEHLEGRQLHKHNGLLPRYTTSAVTQAIVNLKQGEAGSGSAAHSLWASVVLH
ncbi:g3814 [Coccomyxa elongata]